MSENIIDVMFWDITNLVERIKNTFPNHNSIPQVDKAISLLIDARKLIGRMDDEMFE